MFFKKKKEINKKQRDCKIHFNHKECNTRRVVRKKTSNRTFSVKTKPIKPLKGSRNSRAEKAKAIKRRNSILNVSLLVLILFVGVFGIYITINFITGIRGGTSVTDILDEKANVEGIESLPIYPGSEFVYKDSKDEEIVMRMLNQGLSVYRLPRNTKTSEVYEYYLEILPENEWIHLSTIPMSTEDKLLGQYWLRGEKGLRIYVENNDVWYELVTKTEAENSLADRRIAEIQRKRILETSSEQSLLPDYPWILQIPREYLTRYSSTDIGELQSVEIFEIGGQSKFLIFPIGKSGEGNYDKLLQEFLEKQSERLEEDWSIVNTVRDFRKEREVLTARLLINGEDAEGIVFINKRNFIIYAIIANEQGHPFFEQIINEIHEP